LSVTNKQTNKLLKKNRVAYKLDYKTIQYVVALMVLFHISSSPNIHLHQYLL
jgi:hypothetical protein